MNAVAALLLLILAAAPWPLACVPPLPRAVLACMLVPLLMAVAVAAARGQVALRTPAGTLGVVTLALVGLLQCVPLAARDLPPTLAEPLVAPVRTLSLLPERSLVRALEVLLVAGVMVASATLFADRRRARWCVGVLLGVAGAVATYGILARFGALPLLDPEQPRDVVAGSYVNRNHFAGLLELALLAGLGLFWDQLRRSREQRRVLPAQLWTGAGLLLCCCALVASESRGGIACVALGVLAFAVLVGRAQPRRWLVPVAGVLLVAAALVLWLAPPTFLQRFGTLRTDLSFTGGRPAIWAASLRLWQLLPWSGVGLGVFGEVSALTQAPGVGGRFDHAHADWLEFLVEAGPLGLVAMLAALVWFVRAAWHAGRSQPLLCGATAGVLALAVHGVCDFNLQIPGNALWCAALAGLAGARREGRVARVVPTPAPVRLAAAAAAVLLGLALVPLATQAAAETCITRAARSSEPERQLQLLDTAAALWPGTGEAAERAGWTLVRGPEPAAQATRVAELAQRALRGNPFAPSAWELSGRAHLLLGDWPAAERALQRALICFNPDDRPRIALHVARLWLGVGEVGRAVASTRAVLTQQPGLLERALGPLYTSLPAWELLADAVPDTPDLHLRAARFLLQRGDFAGRELELARATGARAEPDTYTLAGGWQLRAPAVRCELRYGSEVLLVTLPATAGVGPAPRVVARLSGPVTSRDGFTLHAGRGELAVPFPASLPPGSYQLGLELDPEPDVPVLPLGRFERAEQVLALTGTHVLRADADFHCGGDGGATRPKAGGVALTGAAFLWRRVRIPEHAEALAVSLAAGAVDAVTVELDGRPLPNQSAAGLTTGRFALLGLSGERTLRIRPARPDQDVVVEKVLVLERGTKHD